MNIKLHKATNDDITFLLELRRQTMIEHLEKVGLFLSEEQHLARVRIHFDHAFIILQHKEKIGVLKYIETDSVIEILQLQITPKFQGKGIGNYVLNDVIEQAIATNKEIRLKVLKENPAKFLYERNGFSIYDEDSYEFYMKLVK
ncbi:GNAT family N-acetyltransferase [uncultured Aquimarina sp.]|uniref:GNAT family N-acetyltransferase n=1 Tax=uncultured Aquimarina sp. TaxID=575652 RepID=UPI0026378B70|nr:GNAT family N-acetyltransferase [uncultured Aquimarina sp.]